LIGLSGRVIPGLDEFMLRLGHLKVVSSVAVDEGGSPRRVERIAAEVLTADSFVPTSEIADLMEYLYRKKLCRVRDVNQGDDKAGLEKGEKPGHRYPNLVIEILPDGNLQLTDGERALQTTTVWWQDRCLASPEVVSKVGAVTVQAKSGSKTGLSHIIDWAEKTGLISSTAQATPEGHLLARLDGKFQRDSWSGNPYILGTDAILIGYIILSQDLDIFSRFVLALEATSWPLEKQRAKSLFAETLRELVEEGERAGNLTPRQRFHLTDQLRELERAARKKQGDITLTSTTWHRVASRLESYVDLGILTKNSGNTRDRFEYRYYGTPKLSAFARSLRSEADPMDWIETHLVACLLGKDTQQEPMGFPMIRETLARVMGVLRSPSAAYPIEAVALGMAGVFANTDNPISIACARRSLEELARSHPDLARLARGTVGQRAEYISLDVRKLADYQVT